MRPLLRIKFGLIALMLTTLLLMGCGGGDEEDAASDAGDDSLAQRVAQIEAEQQGFRDFIRAHMENDHAPGQTGSAQPSANGVVQPTYTLSRDAASENEHAIVRWIADCSVRNYLNPDLPPEIIDREIEKTESEMWDSLESGQYVSFEAFIGTSFNFCRPRVVEPDEAN